MVACNGNKLVGPKCRPHLHFADCLAWGKNSYVLLKAFWDLLLHIILFVVILLRYNICTQVQRVHSLSNLSSLADGMSLNLSGIQSMWLNEVLICDCE